MAGWDNFFVAEAGASAALTGLLFVAVSINLTRILQFPHLPGRASETLLFFLSVLVTSTFCLVPGQSTRTLGIEITVVGLIAWVLPMIWQRRDQADARVRTYWKVARAVTAQLATLPFLVTGVALLAGMHGAIYIVVAGVIGALVMGVYSAWVLLVEIMR